MSNSNKQQNRNKSRSAPVQGPRSQRANQRPVPRKRRRRQGSNDQTRIRNLLVQDFTDTAPVSYGGVDTSINSVMINGKGGYNKPTVIAHREFLASLSLTNAFQASILRLRLNPASVATFPWASNIAYSFETYRFRRLKFIYVTRMSTNTAGQIIFSPDYDAEDAAFTTESQLTNNVNAKESAVWKSLEIPLRADMLNGAYKRHYIMSDVRFATTTQDVKTIDSGTFQIAGETGSAGVQGKLWVEYEIELYTPQFPTEAGSMLGGGTEQFNVGELSNIGATGIMTGLAPTNQVGVQFEDVLDRTMNGTTPITFPTNIIGTFKKDFEGALINTFAGTNMSILPTTLLNSVTNTGLSSLTGGVLNSTLTQGIREWRLNAKKGDILSFSTGFVGTTLTGLQNALGGANFPSII
jgi:hypothetical protein